MRREVLPRAASLSPGLINTNLLVLLDFRLFEYSHLRHSQISKLETESQIINLKVGQIQ